MPNAAGQAFFYYLAAASIATAILAVTRRNPIHAMLWVLALFLHVAGIFLMAGAEFLAAVQVIVYAGAILVFYLFFLMLLDLPSEEKAPRFSSYWPLCVAAGVALASVIAYAQIPGIAAPGARELGASPYQGNLAEVGTELFTNFALPFEIVSLILLAAIVGAVVVARRRAEP